MSGLREIPYVLVFPSQGSFIHAIRVPSLKEYICLKPLEISPLI